MTPNPNEASEIVSAKTSLASMASAVFLLPLFWQLVGLMLGPPLDGHLWEAAGMAFTLWIILLVPGGVLAVIGLCCHPSKVALAILISWMVAPLVTTTAILLHG